MPFDFNQENPEPLDPMEGLDAADPAQEANPQTSAQAQEQEAEAVVAEYADEVENQMSEVEKRLDIAQYYNLILKDNLFEEETESSQTVQNELREFIRGRLAVLLGMKPEEKKAEPPPPPLFDQEEVAALKALAARVLKRPDLVAPLAPAPAKPSSAPPALKKVETATITRPAPRAVAPAPALRKSAIQTQSKVIPKPVATRKQAKSTAGRYKSKAELPPALRDDPAVEVEDGKVFKTVVTEDGKEVRMNITPPARPKPGVGIVPFPPISPEQQNMINVQHADMALRAQGGTIAKAITIASSGVQGE